MVIFCFSTAPVKNSCVVNLIPVPYRRQNTSTRIREPLLLPPSRQPGKTIAFTTLNENFTRECNGGDEYSFTPYYYNRAGNLERTVPPNGADPGILSTVTAAINPTVTLLPAYSSATAVAYNFASDYQYDSYNNLLQERNVDGGQTVYYYDQIGRIVASQNAKQLAASNSTNVICSYSLYDNLGRITETGQMHFGSVGSWTNTTYSNFLAYLTSARDEVTRIYYDRPTTTSTILAAFTGSLQQNLRNRVSYVTFASVYTSTPTVYDHATYYSYDDHGNVIELVQHNKQLDVFGKGLNTIGYEFDLISGNMLRANYQRNQADRFSHKYYYDADNRLKEVYTSNDDLNWDRDAKYFYYEHGPLARVERADKKVQGSDYFYTIHGWIKAVNNDALVRTSDPGKDGTASLNYIGTYTNVNNWVAGDAMGFSLNYYNTSTTADYKPIKTFNSSDQNPIMSLSALTNTADPFYLDDNSANLTGDGPDLFNGNIASMNTVFIDKDPTNTITNNTPFPQLTAYRYDQLQRLTKMKSFRSYSTSNYTWNPGNTTNYDNAYKMNLGYDNNGNILSLMRNGAGTVILSGASYSMDNLSYSYYNHSVTTSTGSANFNLPYNSNKLRCVTDAVASGNYSDDLDHIGCDSYDQQYTGTPGVYLAGTQRYGYDEIGNLMFDRGEYIIKIDWTVDRKVKRIWRDSVTMKNSGITKPDIIYEYNSQRQRVTKIVIPRILATGLMSAAQNWIYTYYVYDASGNVLTTYDRSATLVTGTTYKDKLSLKENIVYGSSRLAIALPSSTLATWSYSFNSACSTTVCYCRGIPTTSITPPPTPTTSGYTLARNLGYKDFELSNHQGNVVTTVSDRKLLEFGNGIVNDNFTSSLNGWTNATLTAGQAVITTSVQYAAASKIFNTVPGKLYRITYSTSIPSGAVIQAEIYTFPSVPPFLSNATATVGTNQLSFIATSLQSILRIQKANAPGTSITYSIDNVVIDQPSGYRADVVSNTDYYPFGQTMPGRKWLGGDQYRYGYQDQETDQEFWNGAVSYEFRIEDPRVGRFFSVDPLAYSYPWNSPYAFSENKVISCIELEGLESVGSTEEVPTVGATRTNLDGTESTFNGKEWTTPELGKSQSPAYAQNLPEVEIGSGSSNSSSSSASESTPSNPPSASTANGPGNGQPLSKESTNSHDGSGLMSVKNAVWRGLEAGDDYVRTRSNMPDARPPVQTSLYGDIEYGEGDTKNEHIYGKVVNSGNGIYPGMLLGGKGKTSTSSPETNVSKVLDNFADIGDGINYLQENTKIEKVTEQNTEVITEDSLEYAHYERGKDGKLYEITSKAKDYYDHSNGKYGSQTSKKLIIEKH